MHGILRYAAERNRWSVAVSPDFPGVSFPDLCGWSGDGAIVVVDTLREVRAAAKLRIPIVNISSTLAHAGVPRVSVDNLAIGRLAAQHLLDCGFKRLAYYGVRGLWYSEQRGIGFTETVKAAGGTYSVYLAKRSRPVHAAWSEVDQPLCNWLRMLNPPVGVFACHDYRARLVLEACRSLRPPRAR